MALSPSLIDEIDSWFTAYFEAFIDIGNGKRDPDTILLYWDVPLHTTSPVQTKWLRSPDEVVSVLTDMQSALKRIGYTHTVALDKTIEVYTENASRIETIMSRRRGDDTEVDRAAVSFELRRSGYGWIIISTVLRPTGATRLSEVH